MQTLSSKERTRQILMLVFSILAMLGFLAYGGYNLLTAILDFSPAAPDSFGSGILGTLSTLVCAALIAPMLVHSLRRLNGKEIRPWAIPPIKAWQAIVLFVVWAASAAIAGLANSLFDYGWVIAIPFFLAGLLLPVVLLIWMAAGGLTSGSSRRLWAVFGTSMGGSTILALVGEYLVIGGFAIVIGVVAFANPDVKATILQLENQLNTGMDMETMLTVLAPYLTNPLVLVAILVMMAGFGPMIEEAVKPAVLWFLGKDLHSPAEGFALGALAGAGFALLEGMLAASGAVSTLGIGIAARFASTMMHITASGLVGWGIASIRLEKRYLRGVGAYLLACTLHGLWNGSVVVTIYGGLRIALQSAASVDVVSGIAAVFGVGVLGLLAVATVILLPTINRHLRNHLPPVPTPAGNDIIPVSEIEPERTMNGLDSQSS